MTKIDEKKLQGFLEKFRCLRVSSPNQATEVSSIISLSSFVAALRDKLAGARDRGLTLNPWTAAGVKRNEVRNCAVLATLIDSDQLGATARRFLAALLARVPNADQRGFPVTDIASGHYVVRCETCIAGDWSNRVDLMIESTTLGDGWTIAIEAKIDAGFGKAQLEDYHADLHRRAKATGRNPYLIFLAPFEPRGLSGNITRDVDHLRWSDVRAAANEAMLDCSVEESHARFLLGAFGDHVAGFS